VRLQFLCALAGGGCAILAREDPCTAAETPPHGRTGSITGRWQSYRTRRDRTLLQAAHLYTEAGEYDVLVKVIDLVGNDTTKSVRVS
jgi:hypothetical protein